MFTRARASQSSGSAGETSQELVLATWNPQKLRELAEVTRILHVKTFSAEQAGLKPPSVMHATAEEDSEAKASAVARASNRPALADCAVLQVPALKNAPGLTAASIVQEAGGWEGAMDWLHEQLKAAPLVPNTGGPDMRASYQCTMTLALPNGKKVTVSDTLSGKLVWPPRGDFTEGSGFYAMFVAEGEAQTLQEMNLEAFEAMANSNHRFGAFEETIKAVMKADMADMKLLYNPFTAYNEKHKNLHEPEPITPLQDILEYVRPPGTEITNNEYIKPYINPDVSQIIIYPQVATEETLNFNLEYDPELVRDDCEKMMDKSFELHCAATAATSAGRDSLTLESQALDMAQNAAYMAAKLKDVRLEATALVNVATLLGPSPKSLQMLEKAIDMADGLDDVVLICLILGKISAVQAALGDVDAALMCLEQARKIAVAQELMEVLGSVYYSYTELLVEHGEQDKALTYAHETLRLAKELEDLALVMRATTVLAKLYQAKGQLVEAHEARGTGLEAAAEAATQLQDLDAVMATQSALKEWRREHSKMPMSQSPVAPAHKSQSQSQSHSAPSTSPEMHDTPLRSPSAARPRRGGRSGGRGSGPGKAGGGGRPSRLPPPAAGLSGRHGADRDARRTS